MMYYLPDLQAITAGKKRELIDLWAEKTSYSSSARWIFVKVRFVA